MERKTNALVAPAALSALLLSGCGGALPALHVYSLPPEAHVEAPTPTATPLPGVVTVLRPTTNNVLNNRRMAWRSSPYSLSVGNYPEHLWAASPPEEMQVHIDQCLSASRVAEAVSLDNTLVDADWIVTGRLLFFEQQLTGAANAQARITADLTLIPVHRPRQPIWRDIIDVAVPLPDARPEHIACGIQQGLRLFCSRLQRSLKNIKPSPVDS